MLIVLARFFGCLVGTLLVTSAVAWGLTFLPRLGGNASGSAGGGPAGPGGGVDRGAMGGGGVGGGGVRGGGVRGGGSGANGADQFRDKLLRAPGLDVIVSLFTWFPWLVCLVFFGWWGLLGAILGEVATMLLWVFGHEMLYREAAAGPRIVTFINRTVGRWQNHVALWVTVTALPCFLLIRLAQIAMYPALVGLLNFPKYRQSDWVNVSRQKFSGLVGHDLIWCLYCDWMTGVYALGTELLRNVESFWCPIRFYDGKKCDNCKLDFPDVNHGWVPAGWDDDRRGKRDAGTSTATASGRGLATPCG